MDKTKRTRPIIIKNEVDTDFGTYHAKWDGSQWCWNVDGKWKPMDMCIITPTDWRIPESPTAKFLDWLYIMGDSFHWKPFDDSLAFNTLEDYQESLRIWKDMQLLLKQRRKPTKKLQQVALLTR